MPPRTSPGDRELSVPLAFETQDRAAKVVALRAQLLSEELTVLPGVTNALLARLAEEAGFAACYATGAGIANWEWALPDIGAIGGQEMAEQVERIADATALPVIADADNGYGGVMSVVRTVHSYERAGAAGLQLEDQASPKRCGHFAGKTLVSTQEMAAKLRAAALARTQDTVLIARTDAIAVEGLGTAMERGHAYLAAGADVLFIEAPEDVGQLEAIGREFRSVPLIVNVVNGGKTPEMPVEAYREMGFRVVLFANVLLGALVRCAEDVLRKVRVDDREGLQAHRLSWDRRQSLVGLAEFDRLEDGVRNFEEGRGSGDE